MKKLALILALALLTVALCAPALAESKLTVA